MKYKGASHIFLILLASSYITLSLFRYSKAQSLLIWVPYAVIALALIIINIWKEHRGKFTKRHR